MALVGAVFKNLLKLYSTMNKTLAIVAKDFLALTFSALVLISCNAKNAEFTARIISHGSFNIPNQVLVSIQNNSSQAIKVYKPSETDYFLWEFEIQYENGEVRKFIKRADLPWHESEPVEIGSKASFIDTISVYPSDFFGQNEKRMACSPFLHAKRMRLIYNFPGHKYPSENVHGVFVPENDSLKFRTLAGVFTTNWVGIGKIDQNKIKEDSVKASKITDWLDRNSAQLGIPQLNCGYDP
jgi:hypothetical protein